MRFIKQIVISFLFAVLLVACSGSGGGSESSTPLPSGMAKIDASSAAPIAQGTIEVVFSSGKFAIVLLGVSAPMPVTTTPCVADGSVTVSGQVAGPGTLSAGDRILLQFFDCDDGAGQVLNGTYQVDVNSFSGDLLAGLVQLNAAVTLDGFEVTEGLERTSLTGGVTLDLDTSMPPTTSISVSGDSVSVSDNTDAATLTQFRIDATQDAGVAPEAYTSAATGTLSSTLFGGAVNYSTPIPFMGYANEYPFTGELSVTGSGGAAVSLFALDSVNVRLEVNPGDASGIVSTVMTWEQLANGVGGAGTGIRGQVIRGPINPGPDIEGVINEEPFSASFSVLDSENNIVARFESDENGNFEVALAPGEYTVVPGPSAPILFPEQQTKAVTVPEDGFADVFLEFDTGIR
jgi:hypothetical protein